MTQDTSTGDLLIGASNNSNFAPREDLETLANFSAITAAGWYTFEHTFAESVGGFLEVTMRVLDTSDTVVFEQVITTADSFANDFGGNRYGWFTNITVADGIAVDNLTLTTVSEDPVEVRNGTGTIIGQFDTIENAQGAIDGGAFTAPVLNISTNGLDDGFFYVAEGMSIQVAVDAASDGDTIMIGVGSYGEMVTVDKELTLLGPNSGLAGNDSARGGEAVITGQITLASENVTIDGLAFDTAGAAIRGGATGTENYSGITIQNSAFLGLDTYGTQFITNGFGSGGSVSGATNWSITGNFFDGATGNDQSVMRLDNIDGLIISDNVMRHDDPAAAGRRGVQLASVENVVFADNDISLGLTDPGNTTPSFTAARYGLQISMDSGPSGNISVSGNTFDGAYDGIITLGNGILNNLTIDDNTFTNSVFGVRPQAGTNDPAGAINGLVITNNTFDGQKGLLGAIRVTGADPYSDVEITNNTFVGAESNIFFGAVTINGAMLLEGSGNADVLVGGSGNDTLMGLGGDDTINGGAGNDVIFGGDGDDLLNGGSGNDQIFGGDGDDTIVASAGNDVINGGAGLDTYDISAAGAGGALVDLLAGSGFSSVTGLDSLTSIERVIGSAGNDALLGNNVDNIFVASGGTDTINGRGGFNTFDASAATDPVVVNLQAGTVSGAHAGTIANIQHVITGSGDDVVTGSAAANLIATGAGDDVINLVGGNDTVDGGAGMDVVNLLGSRADYDIAWDGTTATVTGNGDTVTITNAGQLSFADIDVFLVSTTSDEFATIESAVDAATDGDEIMVAAGTYAESLAINKGVAIIGANAGLSGSDAGRGAESILDGTLTIGAMSAVTIDGMKIVSDDPLPRAKINAIFVTTANDHVITNSVFESSVAGATAGDWAIYTTVLTSGALTITDNFFGGDGSFGPGDKYGSAAWDRGIWSNVNGATLVIDGNSFENTRTGITLEGYNDANTTVSNNSFLNAGTAIGVGIPTAGTFDGITDNTFENADTDFNPQNLTADLTVDLAATGNTAPDVMLVRGGSGNDLITGTDGDDVIIANAGDDTIIGGAGDDTIFGGSGENTFVLSGNVADYQWTAIMGGFEITDLRPGSPDGTDTLLEVEFVQFDDITLSVAALFADVQLFDEDGNLLGGFDTIQDAVDAATGGIGEVIQVAAGTYAETVTIGKSLTIEGANAGLTGTDAGRGAESVLEGQFILAGSGITINGVTIDGGGSLGSGVRGSGSIVADDIAIINSVLTGQTGQPILYGFGQGGAGADGWAIIGNHVTAISGANATAMVLFNIDSLAVVNNVIDHDDTSLGGRRGINLDGIQNGTVATNTLNFGDVVNTSWGIQISMSDREASDLTVANNMIADVALGVSLLSQRSATDVDIVGNTISGTNGVLLNTGSVGPLVSGVTMADITVAGNTIDATSFAVFARDLHDDNANGPVVFDSLSIANNTITGGIVQVGRTETFTQGEFLNVTGSSFVQGSDNDDVVQVEGDGFVVFSAGDGNDTFRPGEGGGVFFGGADSDTLDLAHTSADAEVDLEAGLASSSDIGSVMMDSVENAIGGSGNDLIIGSASANLLQGGDGDDTIIGSAGNDTLQGGSGDNTLSYANQTQSVFVSLLAGVAFGVGIGTDMVSGFRNLIGGNGNDVIFGSDLGGVFAGGAGNDLIYGGAGVDTFIIGDGNNTVFGGAGDDVAVFGQDWTVYTISFVSGTTYTFDDGTFLNTLTDVVSFDFNGQMLNVADLLNQAPDSLIFGDPAPIVTEDDDGAIITQVFASDPNALDVLTFSVDDGRFEVVEEPANSGNFFLQLKAGEALTRDDDQLEVEVTVTDAGGLSLSESVTISVDDVNQPPDVGPILGVWSPDAVEAGSRRAELAPEAGVTDPDGDTLTYEYVGAVTGGALYLGDVAITVGTILTEAEFEAMTYMSPETDGTFTAQFEVSDAEFNVPLTVSLSVFAGVDEEFQGTAGNDIIDGAAGNDTIFGNDGDDLIFGGSGNDVIFGGAGDDTIIGGAGVDMLTGGEGADVFVWESAGHSNWNARDTITDFTPGEDQIDISAIHHDLSWAPSGFTGVAGEVWYNATNGRLWVDLNGSGGANFGINLTPGLAMSASDLGLASPGITGTPGNDTLIGTAGNDTFFSSGGQDVFTGNGGADTFIFASAAHTPWNARDTITDFTAGEDTIDLSGLHPSLSWAAGGFTGVAGQVWYNTNNGVLWVDMNGSGKANVGINLDGIPSLTEADLIL